MLKIGFDHGLYRARHVIVREGRANNSADLRVFIRPPAERDLIEFFAVLFDAEQADIADVMMAARIDAAGYINGQAANIMLAADVFEFSADGLGGRNLARIGEVAVIQAGAGDDVADMADIGRGESVYLEAEPQAE